MEIVAIDRVPPDIREKVKENCRTETKLHKEGEFVDFEECWKINKRQKKYAKSWQPASERRRECTQAHVSFNSVVSAAFVMREKFST